MGIGFVLFYAPIFFVNQVGLSATQVGLGIGSEALSGLLGRLLGGSMTDSPYWGRRRTLLLSALISAIADVFLALAHDFPTFIGGNLLMGVGVGLYWPATEAAVADITSVSQRNEAFALVRLADNLGLSLGVVVGGALIASTGSYRALFVVDGITFLLFFGIVWRAIAETRCRDATPRSFWQGWGIALSDRRLLIYAAANVVFTGYMAQVHSTLPVYLNKFVQGPSGTGLPTAVLSVLFTGHVLLVVLCQLPIARALKFLPPARSLMISASLWGLGFVLVWMTGIGNGHPIGGAALALAVMAIAIAAYTPVASSLVVALAPDALRGVYLSVNSMCWALGYLIGPPLGGWALDQSRASANGFWIGASLSIVGVLAILHVLDRRLEAG